MGKRQCKQLLGREAVLRQWLHLRAQPLYCTSHRRSSLNHTQPMIHRTIASLSDTLPAYLVHRDCTSGLAFRLFFSRRRLLAPHSSESPHIQKHQALRTPTGATAEGGGYPDLHGRALDARTSGSVLRSSNTCIHFCSVQRKHQSLWAGGGEYREAKR